MKLPTLYSRTSTGAVQQWTIEIQDDAYRTHHGQVDGKIQTTEWTTCFAKNEGKANATTAEEQALKEAQALWKKQTESGYFEDIDNIDNLAWLEPMRANDYKKVKAKDKKNALAYPLFVQPKLDGHRCIIRKDGAWTRNGKRYASIPHIEQALQPLFERFPDIVLDGELYADKFANDFNELSSIVRKSKPTADDLLKSKENMQYWIYDVADVSKKFSARTQLLKDLLLTFGSECLVFVPTEKVNSDAELVAMYEQCIDQNFEGMMVRTDTVYEFKRTNALLKYKEFQDAEFVAVECIEGNGNRKGTLACIVFVNEDGHRFRGDMTGSRDYNRDLWNKRDQILGTRWTVKFFNRTPDKNIPRFPKVKAQRID